MQPAPRETIAPPDSLIEKLIPGCDFHDAWAVPAGSPGLTALGQFLKAAGQTPRWVSACMALRNRVVSLFGLKDLGGLEQLPRHKAEADYRPGDRVGIFTLFENTPGEVLLGDRDRHLDVTLSVHLTPPPAGGATLVSLTTVVRVHNLLGRVYMLPVTPMHRLIAPAVLRAVARPSCHATSASAAP
ncbi:DUF2867 domain-containing protein [Roseateles sp. LKC17W]|uniref:DUF2867 domain-containing protein n=1 Tax=Pelomonas margarita TaxID=3299031 RepID=A0ABW7FEK2_9BURK